jgi:dTDP-4-amino-4,6-dideoxygalactose transaminase
MGVSHAIAVSSGTAALHLAFTALGLQPGDEVLTPSLNFVAAANCIWHAGGIPRFVDVASIEQPLISPEILERAITPRTRGVCVMHYGGYACDMDAIVEVGRRHGIWVVEDAAHAPGASWKGIPCGAWGDVGCFSFFGNKNLTCGEGGMIVTASDVAAQKIKALRSHGMSSLTWDRYLGHQSSYDVVEAGFNYRIDDLRAAILSVQLSALAEINRRRAARVAWYRELLGRDARWYIPFADHPGKSAYHLFAIVLDEGIERVRVMEQLKALSVQSSVHYPPVHQFAFYRGLSLPQTDLRVTEALGRRLLSLPLYPDMTREQVEWVSNSLRRATSDAC